MHILSLGLGGQRSGGLAAAISTQNRFSFADLPQSPSDLCAHRRFGVVQRSFESGSGCGVLKVAKRMRGLEPDCGIRILKEPSDCSRVFQRARLPKSTRDLSANLRHMVRQEAFRLWAPRPYLRLGGGR